MSRFFTSRRTYQGLLRIFHSCTQASLQNVRRGGATGPRHHRQTGFPCSSRSGTPHCSALTTRARLVLTSAYIGTWESLLQRRSRAEAGEGQRRGEEQAADYADR